MEEPKVFQRKPTRLRAIRYINSSESTNVEAIIRWTDGKFTVKSDVELALDIDPDSRVTAYVYDHLHDTWVGVKDGDWIIEGVAGEFYPHDGDLFPTNYEEVPE